MNKKLNTGTTLMFIGFMLLLYTIGVQRMVDEQTLYFMFLAVGAPLGLIGFGLSHINIGLEDRHGEKKKKESK